VVDVNIETPILETIIIALLRKTGLSGLSKMRLIKLVFFVDLESVRQGKGVLTDCQYRTDLFGVVDYMIWDVAQSMVEDDSIQHSVEQSYFGTPSFVINMKKDDFPEIPEELQEIVNRVWQKYGKMTATLLGNETKCLVPMDDEWEIGVRVDPRDIAYEESDEFRSNLEALEDYPNDYTEVQPINS
jgi:uncharacterized phage-associated protein